MKKKRNYSPETVQRRKRIWRHNGFLGTTAMAQKGMIVIIESTSATPKTKQLASEIWSQLSLLYKLLKERVDAN